MAPLPAPSPQFLRTVSMWRLINEERMSSFSRSPQSKGVGHSQRHLAATPSEADPKAQAH